MHGKCAVCIYACTINKEMFYFNISISSSWATRVLSPFRGGIAHAYLNDPDSY